MTNCVPIKPHMWRSLLLLLLVLQNACKAQFQTRGQLSISEGATIGTKKLLEPSILPGRTLDAPLSIIDGNEGSYFQLHVTKSQDGRKVSYVHLETRKKLDRELIPRFNLNITNGQGYLELTVDILDINDNPPVFQDSEYNVDVNVSVALGTQLLTVKAVDADDAKNAALTYSISNDLQQDLNSVFKIDALTGLISVKNSLKCENDCNLTCLKDDKVCSLVIVATDGGQPRQSAQTVVKVTLLGTNDHDPKITIRVLSDKSQGFASVNERAQVGSLVASVTVTDDDKGLHGQTSLDIIDGNSKGFFELQGIASSSTYILKVSSRARFSKGSQYNLTMRAQDHGIPQRSTTQTLVVKVNEINEHQPRFAQKEYKVEISEATLPGSSVIAMDAQDEDANADLTYDLVDFNSIFKIHSKSGLVTTQHQLDREIQASITLKIKVSDGLYEAFTDLFITVQDVNDETPTFEQEKYEFEVEENFPLRQTFGRVLAIDNDLGESGQVSYSIIGHYKDIFAINKASGELYAIANLDREQQNKYLIKIKATDNGLDQQLSSIVNVLIHIKDFNDNSPIFYPTKYFLDMTKDSGMKLEAIDIDELNQISYELETDQSEFDLDKETGELQVNPRYVSFLKSVGDITNLQVLAFDNEGRKSPIAAQVFVYPLNSLSVFVNKHEFEIVEDSQVRQSVLGRVVGQVNIQDDDVKVEIIDGDSLGIFEIDNQGVIRTKKTVDREVQELFNLTLVAYNEQGFDKTQVLINIQDVNDNLPAFGLADPEVLSIDMKSPIGHPVHRVLCSDSDKGANGELEFMLDSPNAVLKIDSKTGIITLENPLNSKESFDITVKVQDSGRQPLSSFKTYVVRVTSEENEFTPMFDFELYEVSLSELTPVNTGIITMSAIDHDVDDVISYAIVDNANENKFDIFPDGKVYLIDKLDRESKAYYSVIVTATDNGLVPYARSSTSTLVIYVTDENDNAPILEKNEYNFYLKENSPPDSVIGRVSAYDLDLGRNAEITYKFSTDHDLFYIDKQSGFIAAKDVIDRENMPTASFELEVIVSDLGLVPKTSSANVVISILDENDNMPLFSQDVYQASISEAANLGTQVVSVIAKDLDNGENGIIKYEIVEDLNEDETFKIDENSGKIYLQRQLDRENLDQYQLKIQAKDLGLPSLTSTCLVSIQILDENDNDPEFDDKKISLKLSEDANIGDVVHTFKAHDADLGVNGKVNYNLVGNNLNGFSINSESGVLTIASQLDRETRDRVEMVVTAVDNGVYANTGSVSVSIEITDVNDNAPVIQTTTSVFNVKEGIQVGSRVAKIDASDLDIGANGDIRFTIMNSNDVFKINEKTGDLITKAEIDREVQDQYELLIRAKDQGAPKSLEVQKSFTIIVEDINDNAPMITSLNTALVLSGSPRGTPILTVQAIDQDALSNAAINYRLREPSRLVKLDSISGQLTLIQDFSENYAQDPMTLTVIVSDEAVPSVRKSSTATITIIGGRPQPGLSFSTELYEATVSENSPIGSPVLNVNLNGDPQERIQYFVVGCESEKGGKGRGLFQVDKYTGQIMTSSSLDRETEGSTIILHLIALIGSDKMSGTKVKINVQDENDSAPVFDANFDIQLSEAFLPGHQIGYAKATDADLNSILTFSLSLPTQNYLNIDAQSGALTLTSSIDRELIQHLEVVIIASDGLHNTEWKKMIQIQDINDNAPNFVTPQFSFDIFENVERGTFVGKIEAEDSDENEKLTYSFISDWGLDTFSIDPASGIISLSGNALDHESIEHYILTVSASDSGDPVLTATSTVYVNVKDINDNAPVIEKSLYEVKVAEDVAIGSAIAQIVANDADSEENTDLQFKLQESVKNIFDILDNGTIITKTRLDREINDFYAFEVMVADSPDTQTQLISTCIVQVTIEDVNDQVPLFENIERLQIVENSPPNTPVAAIRAIDKDLGRNADIEYLLEDSLGGKFSIGRIDGVLRSVRSLDREEQDVYQLSVTAIDNGSPRLSSRVEITVNVVDINDNPPRFEQKQYSASVLENTSIGIDVLQAHAYDPDVENNGRLRFAILSGDPRGDFEINEANGILRVSKRLDHERQSKYSLVLQVQDSGTDDGGPKVDNAEVTITILDTNDNAPDFENSPYTVHVVEEMNLDDKPIFMVQAKDRDTSPPYNEIEYSIRAGGQHDDLFHVNSSTGQIFVKSKLDREKIEKMTLEIIATDSGSPRLTGTGTVYVIVDDINDHQPQFENGIYEFSVLENVPHGTQVAQVQALDKDAQENGQVTYELIGTQSFIINDQGFIFTHQDLDRESQSKHDFIVIAQDLSKINPKSSQAQVSVEILDENDNQPYFEFEGNSTDFFIPPGLKSNDFILGLSAADKDMGDRLTFSLNGRDAKMFSINQNNGVVTASSAFSDKKSYDITVTVTDSSLRRDAQVKIFLAEELVAPKFDETATPPQANLEEDAPLGSSVVTFKAFGDSNEAIRYAIAGGNIGKAFDVDAVTGIVKVNQTLDYETQDRYELWIKSFYETRRLYSAAKKISVIISDKNDNAPQFESSLIKTEILEGYVPPFDIVEVSAFDPDTGRNGDISFSLDDANNDFFNIDPKTGLIKCNKELDREQIDRFTLKVIAKDNGSPQRLSSTATVLLNVLDANDNPPRFTRLHSINVTENTAIGTNLLKIETVDIDSDPKNADVKFNLTDNPDNAFAIHETLGNISIAKNLDREIRDEYALKVQASDGQWNLETTITVTIQDANDNKPNFDQDLYEFSYVQGNGRKVGRIHALDRDAVGPNSEVTYELSHASDFFQVDEFSGDIIASESLTPRTSNDSYQIRVIVKDGGSPPMSSECQVVINLINSANHAPKFIDLNELEVGVPKSSRLSTVILKLNATDADDDELEFMLKNGNDIFGIIDQDLVVMKPLDLLRDSVFEVILVVQDPFGAEDEKRISIVITDDNIYSPQFQAPTSRIYIREDETVGNVIITVKATDQDQGVNGQIEYNIVKGDPEEMFMIDKSTGSISVAKDLDYEQIPVYNIVIQAEDRGFHSKSATSSVKIILQDVNDNPPTFEETLFEAKLKENSPVGTFVTQMIANDLDSPKNAEIVYDFIDSNDDFEINGKTGIVKTLKTFDYELVDVIILKVTASNPKAKDQEAAITLLKVNIVGDNEFFPRFKQPVFQFAVSESAQDSSLVGQVEAIDNDAGPDGEIFYYFVGSSNNAGFQVDKRTGVITVKGNLDRESQNRYVLTVLAKNRGSIKGNDTDEAQVIIQVQDGNDPPVFRKSQYTATISEASVKGDKVVQVFAVDKDVRPRNSQFVYVIADGNENTSFSIGSSTGEIIVESALDREVIPSYNLTIQAVDNGSPPAIGETHVFIELGDVNDSPPQLELNEAFIKENSPPNSFVAQLTAKDPDLSPNAEPFKFRLINDNALFSLDENSGILLTKKVLDREEFDSFALNIEIQDAGGLSSRSELNVVVGDENDNPSRPRQVQVIIKNFEGTFPGGVILNVRPDDPDVKGNYGCHLISGPENIFIVNDDCSVKAGRIHNGREYDLDIKINDGKHEDVQVKAKLNFVSFSEFAVEESVSLRFKDVEAHQILGFFENIKGSIDNRLIELLSMNTLTDGVVECFVASRENDLFLPKEDTIDHLDNMKIDMPVILDYDPCDENPCLHNGKCSKRTVVLKQTEITESGNTIFNSPILVQNVTCQCQLEYSGDKCQTQKNPCIPNPCQDGQCFQQGDSFRCLCPPLRGGKTCQVEKTNACLPNPCLNGGSCQNAKNNGFFCLCRPGYQGELCQSVIDTCRQNPCLNGGTCISLNPNYKCRCHDHFYGNHCEHSTYGFEEFSFATFPPLDANTNDISVIFATSKSDSLLVYNFGKAAGGRSDFLSVELVDGHPRFSWGGSRTAITRLSLTNKKVDTGRWYKVTATRNNRVASLSVEDCTESGEYCKTCQPDDPRCFTKEVGEAGTLVFHKNPMYFGGISDESSIIDRPGQLEALDFVGCIRSISINGNEKNLLTESLNKTGLKNTCNFAESGSCSRGDECGPTGACIPLWSHHKCKCGYNEILALDCGASFEPFTLTEGQEVHFKPTRLFKHATRLPDSKWSVFTNNDASLSITFRTLTSNGILLKSISNSLASYTELVIREGGILEYHSRGSNNNNNVVVVDTEVTVNDGSWHTATIEVKGNVLQFVLDGVPVGFEVEFSAVHNFMETDLRSVTIGGPDFRGCVTNFTLNNQLQSLHGGKKQLIEATSVPNFVNGCDVEILRVAQPQTALDVGVTVAIAFFVTLLFIMAISYLVFKTRGRFLKSKPDSKNTGGVANQSFDLQDEHHHQQLNNSRVPLTHPTSKPDIIEAESSRPSIPRFNNEAFDATAEHYDIENASSIAPSDIDVVYHYKGYREGRGRSLPKKKGRSNNLHNTPLARLSPSSEMSHNTPRILTLKDLSGKPLPSLLAATEQSERSLNSPVSHFSASSRNNMHRSGLTSENVARFNQQRSGTPKNNSSSLVNTLDLVSMGSGSHRKKLGTKTPTSNIGSTSTTSESSSEDNDNDSFTCSEYECDSTGKEHVNGANEPMNFSKLMDIAPPTSRSSSSRRRYRTSDEDDDEQELRPPRPDSTRSWENLLTWWPDYESFAGVFKDIAELPHVSLNNESDVCRPPPLGEHHRPRANNDEEYI